MRFDESLVDSLEPNASIVVTAVGALAQVAVAAEVGVVGFAADDEQAR